MATSSDRGHVTSAGDPRKSNVVGDKKDSSVVYQKKSVGDDKPHRKAATASDRKAKKIGMWRVELRLRREITRQSETIEISAAF